MISLDEIKHIVNEIEFIRLEKLLKLKYMIEKEIQKRIEIQ